jgi:DNA-binding transcriptional LysR family regulator
VLQPVLDRRCSFGIAGSLPYCPPDLTLENILGIHMRAVAAPHHVLASVPSPIRAEHLSDQVQLVLTDRSNLSDGREFGVLSGRTWRLADLGAKHAFLRAGLGWGAMPRKLIADDLDKGRLVELRIENSDPSLFTMQMAAVYRSDTPPGPAGRWLITRIQEAAASFSG